MSKIKVGQIYEQPNSEIFVVTHIDEDDNVHIVYKDGYTASYRIDNMNPFALDKMLAELPTWRDAIMKLEKYDE